MCGQAGKLSNEKGSEESFSNGCGASGVALWQCVAATDGDDAGCSPKSQRRLSVPRPFVETPMRTLVGRSAKSALTPPA